MEALILILALNNVDIIDVCVDESNTPITCPKDTVCVQEIDGKKVVVPCPPLLLQGREGSRLRWRLIKQAIARSHDRAIA